MQIENQKMYILKIIGNSNITILLNRNQEIIDTFTELE